MKNSFPAYTQLEAMDCGPACPHLIDKHYGKHDSLQILRENWFITREGVVIALQ